jgi:hypothetical protein
MNRVVLSLFGLVLAQTACDSASGSGTGPAEHRDSTAATPGIGVYGGAGGQDSVGTPGGGTGEAGLSATAGVAGQAAAFGPLGLGCDAAAPCTGGLKCFAAGAKDFGVYSPPGGFCSTTCASDGECTLVDPTARCATLLAADSGSVKICAPHCTLGDNQACGGRQDLACWYVDNGAGTSGARVCMPTCNNDDQCPDGTVCDGALNLCSNLAPAGGLALGTECDPASTTNLCAEGFCIELDGGGACTATCRRGTFPQCGGYGEDSICGWVYPGDEAAGLADVGMCANTCSCDAQCAAGSHCVLHPDRVGMKKPGICTSGAGAGIATCTGT